ncbi:hypothetical protein F5I97DRAFT_1841814 [Phlebopus sp. FC_14]|nr:hypothetical protein F5I97DRAFT_1841814 [Phlebopus sp. FC_14]
MDQVRQHPMYWFIDGSLVVRASNNLQNRQDGEVVLFKIHDGLLRRHSNFVQRAVVKQGSGGGDHDVPVMTIPPELGVRVQDFTALLEHLYHDTPLSPEASFQHVAAVLRVSSPTQLDLPLVHNLARSYLVAMFPSGPLPFVHPNHLEEALTLAATFGIISIQKGLYYSLVTTTDFEPDLGGSQPEISAATQIGPECDFAVDAPNCHTLSPTDIERCRNLMNAVVEHFTPILFTPPATPHMACTDVFADKWMSLVILSAIAENAVYKPLETLENIKRIDWAAEGLCPACVREKRQEWTKEQEDVWEKMDAWLELETKQ